MATFEQDAKKRLKDGVVVADAEPYPLSGGVFERTNEDMFARELRRAEAATAAGKKLVEDVGNVTEIAPDSSTEEQLPPVDGISALPEDEKQKAITAWRSKYDGERRKIMGDIKALGDPNYKLNTPFGPITEAQLVREMGEYKRAIASAQARMTEGMSRIERAEVADKIMEALTYLAAGMHGAKTGVDVSGVKYNPIDWSKRFARETEKFNSEMSRLKNERDIQESMLTRLDKQKAAARQERQDKLSDLDRRQRIIDDLDNADYRAASLAAQSDGQEARSEAARLRAERDNEKLRQEQFANVQRFTVQASKAKTEEERKTLLETARGLWKDLGGNTNVFTDKVEGWIFDNDPEPRDIAARIAELGMPSGGRVASPSPEAPSSPAPQKTYKAGDTKNIGGVIHVRDANGQWWPQ